MHNTTSELECGLDRVYICIVQKACKILFNIGFICYNTIVLS